MSRGGRLGRLVSPSASVRHETRTDAAAAQSNRGSETPAILLQLGGTLALLGVFFVALRKFGAPYLSQGETLGGATAEYLSIPLGALIFFSILERVLPCGGPRKSPSKWLSHLQMNLLTTFMFLPAGIIGTATVAALGKEFGFRPGFIDLRIAGGKGVLAIVVAAVIFEIVSDFFFYWMHRGFHKSAVLWQHHKMHHMDEQLDATTVSRQNWMEVVFSTVFIGIPLSTLFTFDNLNVFQLGLMNGAIVGTVSTVSQYWIHANIKASFGKASILWCGPQLHRIHHSRLPQHRDKNFCSRFPLWDILFGTYYAPASDEYPPTGVPGETEIRGFCESQIFTQREWWKMFQAWRRQRGAHAV